MHKQAKICPLWEVTVAAKESFSGAEERLQNVFLQAGLNVEEVAEVRSNGRLEVSVYFESAARAKGLQRKLLAAGYKSKEIVLRRLVPKDWVDKWKRNIKPFYLAGNLYVVPAWHHNARIPSDAMPIVLDTIFAFGTGLHETTRFMAEFIYKRRGDFNEFFDVGTGTGILSMVAARCGAKMIDALDVDPECIKVARSNLRANGLKFRRIYAADVHGIRQQKQYDFVAANLVTLDLIQLAPKVVKWVKRGKYLAVSGISLENLLQVRKRYREFPLELLAVSRGKKWAAILFRKV